MKHLYLHELIGTPNKVMFISETEVKMTQDKELGETLHKLLDAYPTEAFFIGNWFIDYKRNQADLQITEIPVI